MTKRHRDDGKRFVVRADEKLTVFIELERITRELALSALLVMTPSGRVAAASEKRIKRRTFASGASASGFQ